MKREELWLLSIIAVLLLGICVLLSSGIYVAVPADDSLALYRMNKFSGQTKLIHGRNTAEVYDFE